MENLYKAYKDKAQFFLVYIREAHPVKQTSPRPAGPEGGPNRGGPSIAQPKTLSERVIAATACVGDLKLSLPVLIDDMDGAAEKAYQGWPDRLCVIDIDGKVAHHSARGPAGFKLDEAEAALKGILGNGGRVRSATTASQPASRPAK